LFQTDVFQMGAATNESGLPPQRLINPLRTTCTAGSIGFGCKHPDSPIRAK
jgi:hypothetical protein